MVEILSTQLFCRLVPRLPFAGLCAANTIGVNALPIETGHDEVVVAANANAVAANLFGNPIRATNSNVARLTPGAPLPLCHKGERTDCRMQPVPSRLVGYDGLIATRNYFL